MRRARLLTAPNHTAGLAVTPDSYNESKEDVYLPTKSEARLPYAVALTVI